MFGNYFMSTDGLEVVAGLAEIAGSGTYRKLASL